MGMMGDGEVLGAIDETGEQGEQRCNTANKKSSLKVS